MRPIAFFKKYFTVICHGVYDEITCTRVKMIEDFSLKVIDEELANGLKSCHPIEDHLYADGRRQLCDALRFEDSHRISSIIDEGKTPSHAPWCISALKMACALVCTTESVSAIRAATWNLLGCY
jgi:hypothetical protein